MTWFTGRFNISRSNDEPSDGLVSLDPEREAEVLGSVDEEVIVAAEVDEAAVRTNLVRWLAAEAALAVSRTWLGLDHVCWFSRS
jgi:hypothetical protein